MSLHLQRFGNDTALLDLGNCTDAEALTALQRLVTHLKCQQIAMLATTASGRILAQVALLRATTQELPRNRSLYSAQAAALLQVMPIAALARLQVAEFEGLRRRLKYPHVAKDAFGYVVTLFDC